MGGVSYLWLGAGLYSLGVLVFLARDIPTLLKDAKRVKMHGAPPGEMRPAVVGGMFVAVIGLSLLWPIYAFATILKFAGFAPLIVRLLRKVMARTGLEIDDSDETEKRS